MMWSMGGMGMIWMLLFWVGVVVLVKPAVFATVARALANENSSCLIH